MRLFLFFLISVIASGCTVGDKESFVPGYSGNFGEVVVVGSNPLMASEAGKSLQDLLAQPQYGLPQAEPLFTLITATKTNFINVFRTHRNVVLIEIDGKQQGASFDLLKSKWARGQVAIEISASSVEVLNKEILKREKDILRILNNAEINRLIDKNKKFGAKEAEDKIAKKLGLALHLHKDAYVEEIGEDFAWIRVERLQPKGGFEHQISQGLLIYKESYKSKSQFVDDSLSVLKDALTKKHIPGPSTGSYLTTEYRFEPPVYSELNFNDAFAKESRGLWRMENNFMGGPFYLLSVLNEKKNEVVYLYGYVYSPEFDKREYLREVEAMAKSMSFK